MQNNRTRDCETMGLRDAMPRSLEVPKSRVKKKNRYEKKHIYYLRSFVGLGIMHKKLRRNEPRPVLANWNNHRGIV